MIYDIHFDALLNDEVYVYSKQFDVEAASPEEAASKARRELDAATDLGDFGWYLTNDCSRGDQDEDVGIEEDDKLEVDETVVVTQTIEFRIILKGAS